MKINKNLSFPRLCARLGDSPSKLGAAMHNAAFKYLELPYVYVAFTTANTEAGVNAMRELGIRGYSLTIPHKEKVIQFIDELGVEAREIGAVNTLINDGEKLRGENTDWYGIIQALNEVNFSPINSTCLIFGAGGASRAAIYALKKINARQIIVSSRRDSQGKKLASEFGINFAPISDLNKLISESKLFINSSPIGSKNQEDVPFPFDFKNFSSNHIIFDMVTENTKLIKTSNEIKAKTIPGYRMLLHQAVLQFKFFCEDNSPNEIIEKVMEEALKAYR